MNIGMMKTLDAVIGRLAVSLAARPAIKATPSPISAILLIRPGGIGDAVHLIPALNAIKAAYPGAAIDILAEKRNSAIFGLSSHVRHVFHYHRPAELIRCLRTSYDAVIDTEQWHRLSAVVARMTCAPLLIGFATNERRGCLPIPCRTLRTITRSTVLSSFLSR